MERGKEREAGREETEAEEERGVTVTTRKVNYQKMDMDKSKAWLRQRNRKKTK